MMKRHLKDEALADLRTRLEETQKLEMQTAYDAWFVAEVDKGLVDLDRGHVMTDAEATADMEHFFAEIAQEMARWSQIVTTSA